ncbi:hypothetical protein TNCV_2124821 [Trichonephila clavipes]|nr:hypothetical protein TNCV_2124821 [Trichonephila clavipes]
MESREEGLRDDYLKLSLPIAESLGLLSQWVEVEVNLASGWLPMGLINVIWSVVSVSVHYWLGGVAMGSDDRFSELCNFGFKIVAELWPNLVGESGKAMCRFKILAKIKNACLCLSLHCNSSAMSSIEIAEDDTMTTRLGEKYSKSIVNKLSSEEGRNVNRDNRNGHGRGELE